MTILSKYIRELTTYEQEFVDSAIRQETAESYFNGIIKTLDATRWNASKSYRLIQTIGQDYKYYISVAIYVINTYLTDDELKYKNILTKRHFDNLEYEKEYPPYKYPDKNVKVKKRKRETVERKNKVKTKAIKDKISELKVKLKIKIQ